MRLCAWCILFLIFGDHCFFCAYSMYNIKVSLFIKIIIGDRASGQTRSVTNGYQSDWLKVLFHVHLFHGSLI